MPTKKKVSKKEKSVAKIERPEIDAQMVSDLVLKGDLRQFTPEQKARYYTQVCNALGLNPLTKPFDIIVLNNKEVLYANRNAAEQLRKIYGVAVVDMQHVQSGDVYIVTVKVQDKTGRYDMASGAVNIKGLGGDVLANKLMTAETKAKRRATLSICGLGMLDETEVQSIPQPNYPKYTAPETDTNGTTIDEALDYMSKCTTAQTLTAAAAALRHKKWTDDEKRRLRETYDTVLAAIESEAKQ